MTSNFFLHEARKQLFLTVRAAFKPSDFNLHIYGNFLMDETLINNQLYLNNDINGLEKSYHFSIESRCANLAVCIMCDGGLYFTQQWERSRINGRPTHEIDRFVHTLESGDENLYIKTQCNT